MLKSTTSTDRNKGNKQELGRQNNLIKNRPIAPNRAYNKLCK